VLKFKRKFRRQRANISVLIGVRNGRFLPANIKITVLYTTKSLQDSRLSWRFPWKLLPRGMWLFSLYTATNPPTTYRSTDYLQVARSRLRRNVGTPSTNKHKIIPQKISKPRHSPLSTVEVKE